MSGLANEQVVAAASSSSGHGEHTPSQASTPSVQMTSPGHPGGGPAGQAPVASGIVGHGIQLKSSMTGAAVPSGIIAHGIQLKSSGGGDMGNAAVPSGIVAHHSARHVSVGSGVQAFSDGPRGVQAKKDGLSGEGSSSAPVVSFKDIDPFAQLFITEALDFAKPQVARAFQQIAAVRAGPQDKAKKYFKITGDGSPEDLKAIDTVISVFQKVLSALHGNLTFKRATPKGPEDRTQAYVKANYFVAWLDPAIYIVYPNFYNYGVQERACVLIHELTHLLSRTDDHAYLHETGKWEAMSRETAIANADSYGYYAVDPS